MFSRPRSVGRANGRTTAFFTSSLSFDCCGTLNSTHSEALHAGARDAIRRGGNWVQKRMPYRRRCTVREMGQGMQRSTSSVFVLNQS